MFTIDACKTHTSSSGLLRARFSTTPPPSCPLILSIRHCVSYFYFLLFVFLLALCVFVIAPPPTHTPSSPITKLGGVCWNHGVRVCVCLSVCPSVWILPDDISLTAQLVESKLGMVVYYHEPECRAGKLVCSLQD